MRISVFKNYEIFLHYNDPGKNNLLSQATKSYQCLHLVVQISSVSPLTFSRTALSAYARICDLLLNSHIYYDYIYLHLIKVHQPHYVCTHPTQLRAACIELKSL
jgi:hypothetical protein